jgi:hypothetical protein
VREGAVLHGRDFSLTQVRKSSTIVSDSEDAVSSAGVGLHDIRDSPISIRVTHQMTRISLLLQARRTLVAAGIVLAGFAAALAIYLTAAPSPDNPLGYRPEDSKRYLREMAVYGGTANVLASEFRQWFEGLWHGKSLAFTVVFLSVLLALAFLIASTPLPRIADSAETTQYDREGPDS